MKRGAWIPIGFALIWVVASLPASLVRYFLDETQVTLVAPGNFGMALPPWLLTWA